MRADLLSDRMLNRGITWGTWSSSSFKLEKGDLILSGNGDLKGMSSVGISVQAPCVVRWGSSGLFVKIHSGVVGLCRQVKLGLRVLPLPSYNTKVIMSKPC